MEGSLGPVLANIIMTECQEVIVNQLIENNIKFYIRYVDDTSLVIRKKDTDIFLSKLNSLNKNLKLIICTFENMVKVKVNLCIKKLSLKF